MRWPFSFRPRVPAHGAFIPEYGALLNSSNIILTVSGNAAALVFLNESVPDTYYAPVVRGPQSADPFFFANISPEAYPEWTWDWVGGLKATPPEFLSAELRAQARFLTEKAMAVGNVMRELSFVRGKIWTGVAFQETVYAEKQREAGKFRNAGYREEDIMEYPLIVQYADFAGTSLREAADDILFKAKLDLEHLAKTELLRLRYFKKIREAKDPAELREISMALYRDCYHATI